MTYWLPLIRLSEGRSRPRRPASSGGGSCRWAETQPLSEPVEPDRQREDEPELSVAESRRAAPRQGPPEPWWGRRLGSAETLTHRGLAGRLLLVLLDAGGVEGALGRRGGEGVAAGGGGALEDRTRRWRVGPRSRLLCTCTCAG